MGAPEGNDFAVGNPGGGAPEGNQNGLGNDGGAPEHNQNAARHQLTADPGHILPWLEENRPEHYRWVMAKRDSYLENAPFDSDHALADKLTETVVCEYIVFRERGVQVKDGVVTKTHIKGSDGELVEVEDERPENQALNRMDRQVMSKLNKLDCLPSPESKQADAMADMSNDDYVIDVGDAESDA